MKTILFAIIASLLSTQAFALNYGKFRFTLNSDVAKGSPVVFLMTSAGKIKILENDDYYEVYTSIFFDQTTLLINTDMGQEDFVFGSITLDANKALDKCSAWVDQKNGYLMRHDPSALKLERWNKFKKVYEDVSQVESSPTCFAILLQDREEEEI